MSRIHSLTLVIFMVLAIAATPAIGHPGDSNARGCHPDHATGDDSCHIQQVASFCSTHRDLIKKSSGLRRKT